MSHTPATPIKTAILSFGLSGKVFHAPFIHIDQRFELCGIWERSKSESLLTYPGIRIYRSLEEVLTDDAIELVIVNTPTGTHYEYARKALEAGKHVVVEKAFTTTIAEAISLNTIARERKLVLSVYQNRRWDSDFKTVEQVVKSGWLGDLLEASFHFDRYKEQLSPKAHKEVAAPGTGLLNDLGPHIIDQALYLFGMPESLFAHIRTLRAGSMVDDDFSITLFYPGLRVELKSGLLIREAVPAYVLHGRKGSFLKSRADIQEEALLRGAIPTGIDWGMEPVQEAGLLHTEIDGAVVRKPVPSLPGHYGDYYAGIYRAIRLGEPVKVSGDDGIRCMTIIELARESSARQALIRIPQ